MNETTITSVTNATFGNQIIVSDVDRSIISSQILRNWILWIRNFNGTWKILKLVRIDRWKLIRRQKTVQNKESHRRCKHLCHVCIPMRKYLEDIWRQIVNDQLDFRLQ